MDGARQSDVKFLGHTVFVPAHIGEDDGVLRDNLLHVLQNALGGHGEAAVAGDGLIRLLEVGFGLGNLGAQFGIALALGADLLHFFQNLLKTNL